MSVLERNRDWKDAIGALAPGARVVIRDEEWMALTLGQGRRLRRAVCARDRHIRACAGQRRDFLKRAGSHSGVAAGRNEACP